MSPFDRILFSVSSFPHFFLVFLPLDSHTDLSRHIAVIPATTRHEPGSVPTEPFGIGNEDFNAGKKESKYGYPILELYELVRPVNLSEMKAQWGMGGATMGWRYVERDLWENRWGEGQDRSEKVRRVF